MPCHAWLPAACAIHTLTVRRHHAAHMIRSWRSCTQNTRICRYHPPWLHWTQVLRAFQPGRRGKACSLHLLSRCHRSLPMQPSSARVTVRVQRHWSSASSSLGDRPTEEMVQRTPAPGYHSIRASAVVATLYLAASPPRSGLAPLSRRTDAAAPTLAAKHRNLLWCTTTERSGWCSRRAQ